MKTNHQMNYYDYGKNLDIQGIMSVIVGGGVNPDTLDYVDLGLPSGTLWAKHNIQDADGNELYFAWGETQGYTSGQVGTDKYFTLEGDHADDYKYGFINENDHENYGMTKYNNTDGLTVLESEDDAATVNWGEEWKMPTKAEFEELISGTTSAWTQVDGVSGVLFTSTANTNTLFLPAIGYADYGDVNNVGVHGDYWSASLNGDEISSAWQLGFSDGYFEVVHPNRGCGLSVRPVRK